MCEKSQLVGCTEGTSGSELPDSVNAGWSSLLSNKKNHFKGFFAPQFSVDAAAAFFLMKMCADV